MGWKQKYEEACSVCGKPTNEECDLCNKAFCSGCLFKTGKILTFPSDPRNEDYEQEKTWRRAEDVCLSCYQEAAGHSPLVLWHGTSIEGRMAPLCLIEGGTRMPAGDGHSWYSPPRASKTLTLQWGYEKDALGYDVFHTIQLLEFLKANEEALREQAKSASDVLVTLARHETEVAERADLGINENQEY